MRRKRPFTSTCTKNSVVLFLSSPFCVMLKKTVFYYLFPHSSTSFLTGSRLLLVYVLLLFKSVFVFFKVRLCLMAERPGLKRAPFSKKWCNWFSIPYQVLPRLSLETWEGKKNGRRMFCDLSFLADEFSRSPQAPKTSMQNRYKVSSHPLTKMCWKMHRCSLVNQYQVGSSQQQSNLFKAKQQGQKKAEIT